MRGWRLKLWSGAGAISIGSSRRPVEPFIPAGFAR